MTAAPRPATPRPAARARVPLIIPAVLIAATSASILSTDLYIPSLPSLPAYFTTDASTVQLTMSLNLAAFALAQLIYGPLIDRFGRRPVFLAGMIGFVLTSLAAAAAWSIGGLIGARILQGAAAGAESVIALAVIRDLYDEADAVKLLGAYGVAVAAAPAVGPIIGGYVHVWLGWQANFLLLAALVTLVAGLGWRFLYETLPERDGRALDARRLARGYGGLLVQRDYIAYAIVSGAVYAGLWAFLTEAPFLFIDRYGVAIERYGLFQAVLVAAYVVGSFVANRIAARVPVERILKAGLALCVLGAAAMPAAVWLVEGPASITVAISIFGAGLGLVFATAPVRALAASRGRHGLAAAMLGLWQMGGGALGALAVGLLHDGTAWPMAGVLGACTAVALAAYAWLRPPGG